MCFFNKNCSYLSNMLRLASSHHVGFCACNDFHLGDVSIINMHFSIFKPLYNFPFLDGLPLVDGLPWSTNGLNNCKS